MRPTGRKQLIALLAVLGAAATGAAASGLLPSTRGRLSSLACIAKRPAAPESLTAAVKAEGSVRLSWAAGDDGPLAAFPACIGAYQLTIYEDGKNGTGKAFETEAPGALINGLNPILKYTAEVRALSNRGFGASAAAVLSGIRPTAAAGARTFAVGEPSPSAAPTNGWRCVPAEGYPTCSAAAKGLCSPISCADMARFGRCSTSFLRAVDWAARSVTQHCARECGSCGAAALGQASPADMLSPPHDACCAFGTGEYFSTA